MTPLPEWLKRAAFDRVGRLRSIIRRGGAGSSSVDLIRPVLLNWGIARFQLKEDFGGLSATSWRIETPDGMHVLRRIEGTTQYLNYQLLVLRHLATSDFPYEVPTIVTTRDAAEYVSAGDAHWLLYSYLEGDDAPEPSSPDLARSVGTMVAHYDRVVASLDPGELRRQSRLRLFQTERVSRTLAEGMRWVCEHRGVTDLGAVLNKHADALLNGYRIPAAAIQDVSELPKITVYNDWHRYNMIARNGGVRGLIDYDSVGDGPRIVDFQNALMYVLISTDEPDRHLTTAFSEGYTSVLPLTPAEASLVLPVMLDRVAWLLARTIDEVRHMNQGEDLAVRLIHLFTWLISSGDQLSSDVMAAVGQR
jgi:Ser/Thr protein kinase RdoA (MazF antagonist)